MVLYWCNYLFNYCEKRKWLKLWRTSVTKSSDVLFVCSDISRGQEHNPIQCVNVEDDEGEPTDFVYVSENCFTSNISVDRTITSLQSCKCLDTCSTVNCHCGNISLQCWYNHEGQLLPDFNYAGKYYLYFVQRFSVYRSQHVNCIFWTSFIVTFSNSLHGIPHAGIFYVLWECAWAPEMKC
jgi:hypothetical protein